MASLRRFPDSRYWFACFTMPNGRRVQRSTKETDRKKAQRLADQYEEVSRAQQTARQAQRVIADIYARVTGERLPSSTVRAYFDSWLARKQPETAPATLVFYQGKAKRFLNFLGEKAEAEIARIAAPDILAFRKTEAERVSAPSVNHALKFLRMVFEQARRDGLLMDNPAADIATLRKRTESTRRPFTLPELGRLLAVADGEWRSLVLFGFYTGARLGDLARLTWANVDLERDELRFVAAKTGRRQVLPLAMPLRRHLEMLPAGDDPKQPLHSRAAGILARQGDRVANLSREFYDLMAEAGLVPARPLKSHHKVKPGAERPPQASVRRATEISFHALRHTATSLMKNAGVSPAIVGEFIGHESDAVNRIYTHIETASLRRAAETLPDLGQSYGQQ